MVARAAKLLVSCCGRPEEYNPEDGPYKTLAFTDAIVKRPAAIGCGIIMFCLVLSMITLTVAPINVITAGDTFRVRDHRVSEFADGVTVAIETSEFSGIRNLSEVQATRSRVHDTLTLIFEARAGVGNVFDHIETIRAMEEALLSARGFNDYCLSFADSPDAPADRACSKPFSSTAYFYPEVGTTPPGKSFANDTCLPQVSAGFTTCNGNGTNTDLLVSVVDTFDTVESRFPGALDEFVPPNFDPPTHTASLHTKAVFSFGFPLRGFINDRTNLAAQEQHYINFIDYLEPILESMGSPAIEVHYTNARLLENQFDAIIQSDSVYVVAAVIVVVIYCTFHMRSLFLAGLAMAHILLSFTVAYFVYRAIFQQSQFPFLLFLSLYVILGVGADDAFIFVDAWKQSALLPGINASFNTRLAWTYRRAIRAMLVTSATTSGAFFATAASRIAPIRNFGIFSGTVIATNFLLIATWYPCVVVFHARFIDGTSWRFFCSKMWLCKLPRQDPAAADPDEQGIVMDDGTADFSSGSESSSGTEVSEQQAELSGSYSYTYSSSASSAAAAAETHKTVTTAPAAAPPPALAATDSVTKPMGPDSGSESAEPYVPFCFGKLATPAHLQDSRLLEKFLGGPFTDALFKGRYVVLGLFGALFIGSLIVASQLGPATEPAKFLNDDHPIQRTFDILENGFKRQAEVLKLGIYWGVAGIIRDGTDPNKPGDKGQVRWDLAFNPSSAAAQQHIIQVCVDARDGAGVLRREVYCPMEELRDARLAAGDSWPVPAQDFEAALLQWTKSVQDEVRSGFDAGYDGWKFDRADTVGFDPVTGSLRYIGILVNTTMSQQSTAKAVEPIYDYWENFMVRANGAAPAGVSHGVQTSGKWGAMETEFELARASFSGFGISLGLSYVIMIAFTHNIWVATIALVGIMWVISAVVAMMVLLGWQLGIIESINLVILAGLAVDASVHVANHYNESNSKTRLARTRESLAELGISLLSASLTTMLSASMLLFSSLLFFVIFGLFIIITILASSLAAFFFVTTLLMVFGGLGDFGELSKIGSTCHTCTVEDDDDGVAA